MKPAHTETPWILGWGNGLTGSTTPAIGGITVHESIEHRAWLNNERDYPYGMHIPISKGIRTIAIVPTFDYPQECITKEKMMEDAKFIVRACNNHERLVNALQQAKDYIENPAKEEEIALRATDGNITGMDAVLGMIEDAIKMAGE